MSEPIKVKYYFQGPGKNCTGKNYTRKNTRKKYTRKKLQM